MTVLYDGSGEPVFPEDVAELIVGKALHHIVTFDGWQHGAWQGGGVDLILELSDDPLPLPRHYLEHIVLFIVDGKFVAVQGDDLDAVVNVVETINTAASEATQ